MSGTGYWMNSLVASPSNLVRWDIFCRVIDNFGDAGVCWRLAVDLASRGEAVRLFIDQPDLLAQLQGPTPLDHIDICPWPSVDARFTADDVADVVVEAFACDPPAAYIEAMSQRTTRPAWINLEYMSAEDWVETHHRLPSPHPRYALTKHFFFPGFTPGTGGILREPSRTADIIEQTQRQVQASGPNAVNVNPTESLRILLFCYEQPLIPAWLSTLAENTSTVVLDVTPCPARAQIRQWQSAHIGHEQPRSRTLPNIREIPFVSQPDFDHLLDDHDLLFVRGEDSFVRAQLAGKPLIWHIYPQTDDAHQVKLRAFYDRYLGLEVLTATEQDTYRKVIEAWNNPSAPGARSDLRHHWPAFVKQMPSMLENARQWRHLLLQQVDLVSQLREFVAHLVK
jgi:uncharacterized repeat protein (TIGR03837 family)